MKAVKIPPIAPMRTSARISRPAVLTNEDPAVEVYFMDAIPFVFLYMNTAASRLSRLVDSRRCMVEQGETEQDEADVPAGDRPEIPQSYRDEDGQQHHEVVGARNQGREASPTRQDAPSNGPNPREDQTEAPQERREPEERTDDHCAG